MYNTCINFLVCNSPQPICYLGECNKYPKCGNFKEYMERVFFENGIIYITYKQWLIVDQSVLETLSTSCEKFLELLTEKLTILLPHSLIAKQRSAFFYCFQEKYKM